jgi:hypothetical protein
MKRSLPNASLGFGSDYQKRLKQSVDVIDTNFDLMDHFDNDCTRLSQLSLEQQQLPFDVPTDFQFIPTTGEPDTLGPYHSFMRRSVSDADLIKHHGACPYISHTNIMSVEVSYAETLVDDGASPMRNTLSPTTDMYIQSRRYALRLHPHVLQRLNRRQRRIFQQAGLLTIPLHAEHPSVHLTREWLTKGPMAAFYGRYRAYFSRKKPITFEWIRTPYSVELHVTNHSENPIVIDGKPIGTSQYVIIGSDKTSIIYFWFPLCLQECLVPPTFRIVLMRICFYIYIYIYSIRMTKDAGGYTVLGP